MIFLQYHLKTYFAYGFILSNRTAKGCKQSLLQSRISLWHSSGQSMSMFCCIVAFKITVQIHMGKMPFHIRWKLLMMHWWTNLRVLPMKHYYSSWALVQTWEGEISKLNCLKQWDSGWRDESKSKVCPDHVIMCNSSLAVSYTDVFNNSETGKTDFPFIVEPLQIFILKRIVGILHLPLR